MSEENGNHSPIAVAFEDSTLRPLCVVLPEAPPVGTNDRLVYQSYD